MNILSNIWSLPNTFISWLVTRLIPKDVRDTPQVIDGITVYIFEGYKYGFLTNFALGKYVVAMPSDIQHEYRHGVWSRRFGWFYLAPYYYAVYLLITWILGTPPMWWEFSIATGGSLIWFLFQEFLVRK